MLDRPICAPDLPPPGRNDPTSVGVIGRVLPASSIARPSPNYSLLPAFAPPPAGRPFRKPVEKPLATLWQEASCPTDPLLTTFLTPCYTG